VLPGRGGPHEVTDVNPRFGGGFPLPLAAGGRYPEVALALARGERPEPRLGDFREGVTMTRFFSDLCLAPGPREPWSRSRRSRSRASPVRPPTGAVERPAPYRLPQDRDQLAPEEPFQAPRVADAGTREEQARGALEGDRPHPTARVRPTDRPCDVRAGPPEDPRPGLLPVVSNERLSGHPSSGGYDSKEIADRLAAVFPEGKVLIVIREQRSVIQSVYKQYVLAGGPSPFGRFVDAPADPADRVPAFDFRFYEYHHLIRHYQDRFGGGSVRVLAYETFVQDPAEFVRRSETSPAGRSATA
jgi:hypothetical protein